MLTECPVPQHANSGTAYRLPLRMAKALSFKNAHTAGPGDLIFSTKGDALLTCGSDGRVWRYHLQENLEPESKDLCNDSVNTIAFSPLENKFAIGAEDGRVQLHVFPSLAKETDLIRCPLPIRHVEFSPSGSRLAVASDDQDVRIISLSKPSDVLIIPAAHSRGVFSVGFDPTGDYFASSGADGLKLWNLREPAPALVYHCKESATKLDRSEGLPTGGFAWNPSGDSIAVGGAQGVLILTRDKKLGWSIAKQLSIGKEALLCAWAPGGRYLAVLDADGALHLLELKDGKLVKSSLAPPRHTARFFAARWAPVGSALALLDDQGRWALWENALPGPARAPVPPSAPAAPRATSPKRPAEDISDAPAAPAADVELPDASADADAEGAASAAAAAATDEDFDRVSTWRTRMERRARRQAPLRVGAATNTDDKRRFLWWSLVGSVVGTSQADHVALEVEFMDVSKHRNFRLSDYQRSELVALNDHALVLATTESPNRLLYRPLQPWTSLAQAEFTALLSENESFTCVAVGARWVAACTSRHMLRLWTYGGVQELVLSLPAPATALVAHEQLLVVAFQPAATGGAFATFWYDVEKRRVLHSALSMPLSRDESELRWLGFSQEGVLTSMDSEGVIRGCFPHLGHAWVPLLDTAALSDAEPRPWYWLVGLNAKQISCVVCKGQQQYPAAVPRPVPEAFPLQIPLAGTDTAQGAAEEQFVRELLQWEHEVESVRTSPPADLARHHERGTALVKQRADLDLHVLNQLLEPACASRTRLVRALDVAARLAFPARLSYGSKIASRYDLHDLAQRILMLLPPLQASSEQLRRLLIPPAADTPAAAPAATLTIVSPSKEKPAIPSTQTETAEESGGEANGKPKESEGEEEAAAPADGNDSAPEPTPAPAAVKRPPPVNPFAVKKKPAAAAAAPADKKRKPDAAPAAAPKKPK